MKRKLLAVLLTLLLALSLAACGGAKAPAAAEEYYSTADMAMEAPMAANEGYWAEAEPAPAPAERASGGSGARASLPDGVKMIYTANLELETTEFEQAAEGVKTLTQSLGGYFQSQNTYNRSGGYRSASYTVRVSAERFEEFLAQVGDVCTVVRRSQNAEDVSEVYYDVESRLETAKIKLDRLQELLSRAEKMEDVITLESAISETEYQIESLSGEKRHYDALIGYATIYVNLSEVYRVTGADTAPMTLAQRLGAAFRDGLRAFGSAAENLLAWLAYHWLSILLFAAVVVVAVKLGRRAPIRKKEKKPVEPPPEASDEGK